MCWVLPMPPGRHFTGQWRAAAPRFSRVLIAAVSHALRVIVTTDVGLTETESSSQSDSPNLILIKFFTKMTGQLDAENEIRSPSIDFSQVDHWFGRHDPTLQVQLTDSHAPEPVWHSGKLAGKLWRTVFRCSNPLWLSFLFRHCGLWTLSCLWLWPSQLMKH